MASDNPFSEPQDSDRTMFIPAPGGVRGRPAAPATTAASATSRGTAARSDSAPGGGLSASIDGPVRIETGSTPLMAAASGLLSLLARLRNTARPPDAGDLRASAVAELRRFEQIAREAGIGIEQLRPAHYALCASLDDVVLATPWGAEGAWATRSLVSTFHEQVRSGEGFFNVLRQVTQAPTVNLAVLELMYVCLSLGFQGQYRLSPRGPAELDRVREELYALIARHRSGHEPDLSPHWQGVDAPYRPRRSELPLWVASLIGVALLGSLFAVLLFNLGAVSDRLAEQIVAAPPARMPAIARAVAQEAASGQPAPEPLPPPEAPVCDALRGALAADIAGGQVAIPPCADGVPVLQVGNDGMFASGSAAVMPAYRTTLARIGTALNARPGAVTVAGYTDNQRIRSLRYPSNAALSRARAEAALALVATTLADPRRLAPDGRGETNLIEHDPAHQERNRRIEVILHPAEP
nr:type IVB secretion system protein IcmH/DotU [uncultured Lichenicoccus sp.]